MSGWGLAIGGIASAAGSLFAGASARGATQDATNLAVSVQQQAMLNQEAMSQPYRALGNKAIPQLEALLGLGPHGAAGEEAALAATPGYQFAKKEGISAINNASTLNSGPISGNTLESLVKFGTGLADTTYQSAVQNDLGAVGIGQAAAAGAASNIGAGASNVSNLVSNQGNTLAGIDANTAASLSNIIGGGANTYATLATLKALQNQGSGGGTAGAATGMGG